MQDESDPMNTGPLSPQHLLRENLHHTDCGIPQETYLMLFQSRLVRRARFGHFLVLLAFSAVAAQAAD
jgi:hypothetical protein